ncbi:MAG: ABC transporter substrate-binding protein [Kiritimatiellae bacterium]|nr:ABC transporter substrate-binding protein [Kiritimatiellia bacterium]
MKRKPGLKRHGPAGKPSLLSARPSGMWCIALALLISTGPAWSQTENTSAPSPRVVSLAPNLTELVYTLGFGSNLVGRSSACDYPPDVADLPVVGGFGRPNWEALQRLRPDVVIATDLEKPGLLKRLEELGVKTLLLSCEGWEPLMEAGRRIAIELGRAEAGEKWARQMEQRRAALSRRVSEAFGPRPRPSVYVEVWGDPPTTACRDTFLNDLVTLGGGSNIASALRGRYRQVSSEWVIREDPEALLPAYMGSDTVSAAALKERPGWASIRAVQTDAVCTNIAPDLLLRPGPRWMEGAEAFADWLIGRFASREAAP